MKLWDVAARQSVQELGARIEAELEQSLEQTEVRVGRYQGEWGGGRRKPHLNSTGGKYQLNLLG
jgi:hypothetical protein